MGEPGRIRACDLADNGFIPSRLRFEKQGFFSHRAGGQKIALPGDGGYYQEMDHTAGKLVPDPQPAGDPF